MPDRVTWSEVAEMAFGLLRRAFCSEPILITPEFSLPLIVHTGASKVGRSGILPGPGGRRTPGDLHQ